MIRKATFSILLMTARAIVGQSNPQFEVVSIRPHPEGPLTISSNINKDDTYRAVGFTLVNLVADAYSIRRNRVSGAFGWLVLDHFDIEAKATGGRTLTWERPRPMLQAMLADRFKLKVRRETREVAAYDLVVAEGGRKFKENADPARLFPGFKPNANSAGIHVTATKVGMAFLAFQLSADLGRQVLDKTGLAGEYDFKLDWALDGSAPTLFMALQEQLGLKLEPSTIMQGVVIESAEPPSVN